MLYIIRQYASDGFADYDKKESNQWKGNEKMAELDIPDETILLIPDVAAVLKCSDGYVRRLIKEVCGRLSVHEGGAERGRYCLSDCLEGRGFDS